MHKSRTSPTIIRKNTNENETLAALKKYLRTIKASLEKKGIDPDFLAYSLWAKLCDKIS